MFQSNAIKFTDPGGSVRISTILVSGRATQDLEKGIGLAHDPDPVISVPVASKHKHALSETNLSIHNREHERSAPSIIVRIVVTDTGCGIAESESGKLFCQPFTFL